MGVLQLFIVNEHLMTLNHTANITRQVFEKTSKTRSHFKKI